jgi:hypothetical protein
MRKEWAEKGRFGVARFVVRVQSTTNSGSVRIREYLKKNSDDHQCPTASEFLHETTPSHLLQRWINFCSEVKHSNFLSASFQGSFDVVEQDVFQSLSTAHCQGQLRVSETLKAKSLKSPLGLVTLSGKGSSAQLHPGKSFT